MITPSSALFCRTDSLSIPATGLHASHIGIIENEPWSCYLHRNRVPCRRLQRGPPISFVSNQNEKFCWGSFVCVCVNACTSLRASLAPLVSTPSLLVSALRWLHFKLHDKLQDDKTCKWSSDDISICIFLLELPCFIFLNRPAILAYSWKPAHSNGYCQVSIMWRWWFIFKIYCSIPTVYSQMLGCLFWNEFMSNTGEK